MPFATSYLAWSVVCTLFFSFLLVHLWQFDRFKCITWGSANGSSTFKRFMTYTYLLTLPCLMVYSYGMAYMAYNVEMIPLPTGKLSPVPYDLYPEKYQKALLPLILCFTFGWALEMITHLEELCFWLFLVSAGPHQQDWFHSRYFYGWIAGSVAAIVYMPLATAFTRQNAQRNEAITFLCGAAGDFVITVCFLPILWTFPSFLAKIRREGIAMQALIRLTKYYELNVVRILFRFMSTIPLLILALDALVGETHTINASLFWSDLFLLFAALGMATSSIITLFIFFPRSFEAELRAKEARTNSPQNSQQSLSAQRPLPVKPVSLHMQQIQRLSIGGTPMPTPALSRRVSSQTGVTPVYVDTDPNTGGDGETQKQRRRERRVSVASAASSSASSSTSIAEIDDNRYSYLRDSTRNQEPMEYGVEEPESDANEFRSREALRRRDQYSNSANFVVPSVQYEYGCEKNDIGDEEFEYDGDHIGAERDGKRSGRNSLSRSRHNSAQMQMQARRLSGASSVLNPIVHSFRGPLDVMSTPGAGTSSHASEV